MSQSYKCVTQQIYAQQIMCSFASLKFRVNQPFMKLDGLSLYEGFVTIVKFFK